MDTGGEAMLGREPAKQREARPEAGAQCELLLDVGVLFRARRSS
jgi:hypothetical protein